jgi:TonB family protein
MAVSDPNSTYFEEFRRYNSGEMSHAEQYRMEKRMLEDPFYADAYEGYLAALSDGVAVGHTMTGLESELEKRVAGKKRWLVPLWTYAAAAASIVFAFSWLFFINRKAERSFVSSMDVAVAPATKSDSATSGNSVESPSLNATSSKPAPDLKASSTLTKPEYSLKKPDYSDRVALSDQVDHGAGYRANVVVPGRAEAGALLYEGNANHVSSDSVAKKALVPALSYLPKASHVAPQFEQSFIFTSQGRVVNALGQGVPGIAVTSPLTNRTVLTDSLGRFRVAIPTMDSLKLTGIGYRSKLVRASKPDLGEIVIDDDVSALSEVVVAGYGKSSKKLARSQRTVEASPTVGWEQYKAYLAQATQNRSMRGKVKVRFKVNDDGSLTDFKTKGNRELGEEAIKIVRQGPAWEPAKRNELNISETVSIDLSFE